MESKKMIRIAMRLTESIIEILKEEFGDDKKGRRKNAQRKKSLVKKSS
ncbi:MAG: hypothetical protein IPM14_15500 [bacterium]|nr:hypothetical protein [bacterium]